MNIKISNVLSKISRKSEIKYNQTGLSSEERRIDERYETLDGLVFSERLKNVVK